MSLQSWNFRTLSCPGLDAGARLTPAARAEVAALLSEGRGACGSFDSVDAEGGACETSVLRVGDALYVPKGVVHARAGKG